MTTNTNTDARLLELADVLALEVRSALAAFQAHDKIADTLPIAEEMAASLAIMSPSLTIADEMMEFEPTTFLGFQARAMAHHWLNGHGEHFGPEWA